LIAGAPPLAASQIERVELPNLRRRKRRKAAIFRGSVTTLDLSGVRA
jgi:hypothetical protein